MTRFVAKILYVRAQVHCGRVVRHAFTLVEILLSLAVSGMVMLGCVSLMFDMANIAEFFERGDMFKNHADGVEKFLRCSFVSSEIADAKLFESVLAKNSAQTVYVAKDFENTTANEYWLGWGVATQHPLYASPYIFSADKLALLECDDDGLWLVWREVQSGSKTDAISMSSAPIFKQRISKWVKKIGYLYEDSSGWEETFELRTNGDTLMPSYIKLYFERGGEKIERLIDLGTTLDFQISQ